MKIRYKLIFIVLFCFIIFAPKTVMASSKLAFENINAFEVVPDSDMNCDTLLGTGDKNGGKDDGSVMWLLIHFADYIKIIVPFLVVILSAVDFISSILSGSDEKMKKAYTKLGTRLIIAIVFFLIPTLVKLIFSLFGFNADGICINF